MIAVFLAFALSDQRIVKEFGIGLAVAIFVDATIVRLVLVPSVMQLMGNANWWFPGWLDRILPDISAAGGETAK
jgi:RND superfamily putative drug exporter